MVVFTLALLGLVAEAIALPQEPTTSIPRVSPPPPPTTVPPTYITVARTITRSVWTSSGTVQAYLNCTRTIYAPVATSAVAPPALLTSSLLTLQANTIDTIVPGLGARQEPSTTTTIIKTLPGTTSPPVGTSSTTVERPPRTRTTYTLVTVTQTGAITRTNYQCAATLALEFTVDATTTIQYTLTAYASTVTATSTINCPGGFGGGGFGGVPTSTPVPVPVPTATPAKNLDSPIVRRQGSSSSLLSNGTTATSAIHLTRTAYTLVTVNATGALTNTRYECSVISYDATSTIVATRTVWPTTITAASVIDCHLPTWASPTAIPTAIPKMMLRQESSSTFTTIVVSPPTTTASVTTHRTRYVQSITTVTEASPYIQIAYSCAVSAAPPIATSSTPPHPVTSP